MHCQVNCNLGVDKVTFRSILHVVDSRDSLFNGSLSPGEVLRTLMETRSWTQEELALITRKSRKTIQEIMSGKSGITAEMAVVLGAAFETDPRDWLRLESMYRLARVRDRAATDVEKRAQLHRRAPIREMQRRGWIKSTSDISELESELKRFLGTSSLDENPSFLVAPRRSSPMKPLTPAQLVWCVRAKQLAAALQVAKFDPSKLQETERQLRELAAYPKEARHVPKVLAKYGIRFVVVEPLPGSKIDGATFWLDGRSPIIAVSMRYDRIDGFWQTVMHEFSHVRHGDALSIDTEMIGDSAKTDSVIGDLERRANREAAGMLVPPAELESFIQRVGPLYSRQRIIQFAHTVKIHPGIIIGQLQHRGEVGYSALRNLLSKIRDVVTETALTDGWGKSISPGLL